MIFLLLKISSLLFELLFNLYVRYLSRFIKINAETGALNLGLLMYVFSIMLLNCARNIMDVNSLFIAKSFALVLIFIDQIAFMQKRY